MIQTALEASNKEDWTIQFSATDEETGEDIDFTGATMALKVVDEDGVSILDASTADATITITTTTVEAAFTSTQMSALDAKTYQVGCVYLLNSSTNQLFVGYANIYEGWASL